MTLHNCGQGQNQLAGCFKTARAKCAWASVTSRPGRESHGSHSASANVAASWDDVLAFHTLIPGEGVCCEGSQCAGEARVVVHSHLILDVVSAHINIAVIIARACMDQGDLLDSWLLIWSQLVPHQNA